MTRHAGPFLAALLLGFMSIRGRAQELWARWAKAQTISSVLTTRLSSMYVPILLLAFALTLVCVAFACKKPPRKS